MFDPERMKPSIKSVDRNYDSKEFEEEIDTDDFNRDRTNHDFERT